MVYDCQTGHLVALLAQLTAAVLEALFDTDANACHLASGLTANIQKALHCLAGSEEIINDQHIVLRAKEFLRKRDIKVFAVGVGMHHRGVEAAVQIFAFGLFGKHHRHIAEILCRNAGNGNAAGLDGQDLIDACIRKNTGKFLADLLHKANIQLVIQKGVHL